MRQCRPLNSRDHFMVGAKKGNAGDRFSPAFSLGLCAGCVAHYQLNQYLSIASCLVMEALSQS